MKNAFVKIRSTPSGNVSESSGYPHPFVWTFRKGSTASSQDPALTLPIALRPARSASEPLAVRLRPRGASGRTRGPLGGRGRELVPNIPATQPKTGSLPSQAHRNPNFITPRLPNLERLGPATLAGGGLDGRYLNGVAVGLGVNGVHVGIGGDRWCIVRIVSTL